MKSLAMILGGVLVVGSVALAQADEVRRSVPADRPYIVEIGNPKAIGHERLEYEMRINPDLRTYIQDYGYPEIAETQDVSPDWPWADYEVRLFYTRYDQEVAFGSILVEPQLKYGLMKYQGPINPTDRWRLSQVAMPGEGDAMTRATAAAERAAHAADQAVAESETAANAAQRAAQVVEGIQTQFNKQLRK